MSKFNIFTIDLRVIWWIIVATGVYALLLKFLQKKSPHDVQTKGGGGQRPFEQCSKKLHFSYGTASLTGRTSTVEALLSTFFHGQVPQEKA